MLTRRPRPSAVAAAGESTVRLRLIRADDRPATNTEGDAFEFGLQDTNGELVAAARLPDGRLHWDFELRVRPAADGSPNFLGRFASGPADDRFVYLSWRSIPRGVWINRLKARLGWIDWPLIRAAQAADKPITGDLTGRTPRHSMQRIEWKLRMRRLAAS
jgi:hypothetical protein